jgi:hypothetical protein
MGFERGALAYGSVKSAGSDPGLAAGELVRLEESDILEESLDRRCLAYIYISRRVLAPQLGLQ